jgi:WD40 repeat protein
VCWSPDSGYLLTGTGTDKVDWHNLPENLMRVWDVQNGTVVRQVTGFRDAVLNIRYAPNGSWVAAASDDKTIRIFDSESWELRHTLTGHIIGVLDVCWSPDGSHLVSGSRDYKARLWDAFTGEELDTWEDANCVRSVDWHPDGNLVVTSGVEEAQCKIRDSASGEVLLTLDEAAKTKSVVMSSRWSPDGQKLVAGAGKERTVRVYGFGAGGGDEGGGEGLFPSWLPSAAGVIFIAVIGTIALYYPLRKKLREAGR